jgi:hypothetical protein
LAGTWDSSREGKVTICSLIVQVDQEKVTTATSVGSGVDYQFR